MEELVSSKTEGTRNPECWDKTIRCAPSTPLTAEDLKENSGGLGLGGAGSWAPTTRWWHRLCNNSQPAPPALTAWKLGQGA